MKISELKKGFWGYQKESVYQYIAVLNEEFSRKLIEKEKNNEEVIRELREKNAAMEAELASLRKETEEYRKLQFAVSDSIIDAQNYAAKLKNETQKREQALRAKLEEQMSQKRRRMESCMAEMDDFRVHLKAVLEAIDASLEKSQDNAQQLIKKASMDSLEEADEAYRIQDLPDVKEQAADTIAAAPEKEHGYKSDASTSNMSLFRKAGRQ